MCTCHFHCRWYWRDIAGRRLLLQILVAAQLVSNMDVKIISGALLQPWSLGKLKKKKKKKGSNCYDHLSVCGNWHSRPPVHSGALTLYMAAGAAAVKLLQSCQTLWDPIDGGPPGSAVPGILQARTLEWVAISFSNAIPCYCMLNFILIFSSKSIRENLLWR